MFKSCLRHLKLIMASAPLAFGAGVFCEGCGGSASVSPVRSSQPYQLSPVTASNGVINPSSVQVVPRGGRSQIFFASGNTGFTFEQWLIDGEAISKSTILADGTIVSVSADSLLFENVNGQHSISATYTNKSPSFSVLAQFGFSGDLSFYPVYCSSQGTYAVTWAHWGAFEGTSAFGLFYNPSSGRDPLQVMPDFNQVWGVNENGMALYSTTSGVSYLDNSGAIHSVASPVLSNGGYAVNDSSSLLYGVTPQGKGDVPAQFYTQSALESASPTAISSDVQAYFMNDAGTIVGLSNGLNAIPKGAPVAYVGGQEAALPLVHGMLSAFSNTGVLTTVPSPNNVNVYADNGQRLQAQISDLEVDSVSHGSGGYPNPFNRVVGCNAEGDVKVIGRSTAAATKGDWGYWDSGTRSFVDISSRIQWGQPINPPRLNSKKKGSSGLDLQGLPVIVKLWAISDNDLIFATVGNPPWIGSGGAEFYSNVVVNINAPASPSGSPHGLNRIARQSPMRFAEQTAGSYAKGVGSQNIN